MTTLSWTADTNDAAGLCQRGYSKDSRPDFAQAVIGCEETRGGILVRRWVWPPATSSTGVSLTK